MRRWAWLVVIACSSGPRAREPVVGPTFEPVVEPAVERRPSNGPAAVVAAPRDPDPDPDPDRDRIAGVCDLCPDHPETYNGIVDEDGCPDSSGTSHAVMMDPTNRFAFPVTVSFEGLKMTEALEIEHRLDEGIEVIDVIGRSSVGVSPALAAKRAAIVAKELRLRLPTISPGARVVEHVTAASSLHVDDEDEVKDVTASVAVQVMRARGIEIWRWEGDHLVRATPKRRLPVPKLPAGC
jgi:hypothetical protein